MLTVKTPSTSIVLLAAVIICQQNILGLASYDKASPRLVVDNPVFDAGTLWDDTDSVTHTFLLKNAGSKDLVIEHIHTDCSCSAASAERKPIPPGGTFPLEVTFHFKGDLGKVFQTKTIVITNDAQKPKAELVIRGRRKKEFEIYPPNISFGIVPLGQGKDLSLRIVTASTDRTLDMSRVLVSSPYIKVIGTQLPTKDKQSHTYRLQLQLTPTMSVGQFSATIQIPCKGSQRKRLDIPVLAEIKGPITLSTSHIRFGVLKRDSATSKAKQLQLESKKPFKILDIVSNQSWLETQSSKKAEQNHVVSIYANSNALPAKGRKIGGTITIKTDAPGMESICIPVTAFCL